MNKKVRNVLGLLVIALCAGSAFAQMSAQTVVANIPFDFYVGGIQLPAGQYEVYPDRASQLSLVIRNIQTGKAIFALVGKRTGTDETTKAELVFDRDNDKSYLSIVRPFETVGYQLNVVPARHSHVIVKAS